MIQAIIIDTREPEWVKGLQFGGVPKAVSQLEAGDFQVLCHDDKTLIIERKTADDLLGTLKENRLFDQMRRLAGMRADFGHYPYLLISGTLERGQKGNVVTDNRDTGWNWDAVQGALLTVQELGINILQCAGDYDLEDTIIRLSNRDRNTVMIQPQREAAVLGLGAQFLCGLPGIGIEKVKEILDISGTPAIALMALTDGRLKIPGISDGIINNARHVLGLADTEILVIATKGE